MALIKTSSEVFCYNLVVKDQLRKTHIEPEPEHSEQALAHHNNFAILGLPKEYGDQAEIQNRATEMVKKMDLQGKYDTGWEKVPLLGLDENASAAIGDDQTIEPLVRYYASLAKKWGFTDQASLSVFIQSDKFNDNPNETIHRDGVGAEAMLEVGNGKQVRTIRFVYPIGRPGTTVFPELDHQGAVVDWKSEIVDEPTDLQQTLSAHVLNAEGEEKQTLLNEASSLQLMPGTTLVFDMTSSPWHVAPPATPDGAVMTVNVLEAWEHV